MQVEFIRQSPRVFAVIVVTIALLLATIPSKGLLTSGKAAPQQSTNQSISDQLVNQEEQASTSALAQDIGYRDAGVITGPNIPILYYHYIEVNPDPVHDPGRTALAVTPANFESQLQFLTQHGYTFLNMDDVAAIVQGKMQRPAKPIALTFDDGYEDFYLNAWPLLQKYNVKVTIYVMSREGHNGACNTNIWQPNFYMTNDQLRELAQSPLIEVGDHTQDHCNLRGKSVTVQTQEIIGSKTELEAAIGKTVTTFAYPYGRFDNTSTKLVQQAGYTSAVTTIPGTIQNPSIIYLLRRIDIHSMDGSHLGSLLAKHGD